MSPHIDILDESDSLRKPFFGSAVLHAAVFATVLLSSIAGAGRRDTWGDPNSLGGGSVAINAVSRIPLPSRSGVVNPVANDTDSRIPQAPAVKEAKPERRPVEEDLDAIPIRGRRSPRRMSDIIGSRQRYRRPENGSNQLYSSSGQGLVSPMYGQTGSGGGVGVGQGSPFGNRYGYYVDILRQRVAQKWRTSDVDPRMKTAPPVIISFSILRDGSVRDVRILQRSGNGVLDYSAQRAILEASPFPPLPSGFERNDANIEFWFQLSR
jgi:periplasmic protein TonB